MRCDAFGTDAVGAGGQQRRAQAGQHGRGRQLVEGFAGVVGAGQQLQQVGERAVVLVAHQHVEHVRKILESLRSGWVAGQGFGQGHGAQQAGIGIEKNRGRVQPLHRAEIALRGIVAGIDAARLQLLILVQRIFQQQRAFGFGLVGAGYFQLSLGRVGRGQRPRLAREQALAHGEVGGGPLGRVAGFGLLALLGQGAGLGIALAQHGGHHGQQPHFLHVFQNAIQVLVQQLQE